MTNKEAHITEVRPTGPLHDRKFDVLCSVCGHVGISQEYYADAVAIAKRHHDIGGFER